MENTTGKIDSGDGRQTNMQISSSLAYSSNVAMCYPPQPSLSSPLAEGNHGTQATANYLVPPSMASPSGCLTTQQMYSNYPSPYYRSMLTGSQQSSMSSYYGTILPPSHHSSAFYGTFYNPNSPSVYPSGQPSINPINYYSPSLYMQNHETMWPSSNSSSQPAPAKRIYPYDSSNVSQLPSCSKISSSVAPTSSLPETRLVLQEQTPAHSLAQLEIPSSSSMLSSLPPCSSSAVESAAKEADFICGGLERAASKCDTAESPEDDESSVTDKESIEESEDEFNQDEESSSSYSSSYTDSYTSEDLIPIENEEILDKVPENILNDTSFGDIDRAKDLVDDDLQCLLCNNFDHLIPRLDIAIKLEPVVGEPISKSSVLLCTQCDLMLERYLSLEKEVHALQAQIQSMYQNNKHPDKQDEAQYCALPSAETNQEMCINETYATSQLQNPLSTADVGHPSTPEEFESARQLDVTDSVINKETDEINEVLEHATDAEILKPHGCHECGKFYSDVRGLQRHRKTHRVQESDENHLPGQETRHENMVPLQCQQCPRQFQRRSHYHYHVKIHHGPREFKCQICDKAFASRGALTTHGRIHSGEKPYECETCGRRFNVNSNLLAHVPKCTGVLPFKCDHCDKAFATRSLYKTHVKAHQGEFAMKCNDCGMGFSKRSHLIAHQRSHTKEKPFQCPVCGKAFSSIGNCNSHAKTHADERKFVCEMCGKKFARRQALEMHLNRHTGVKPFKCDECSRSFHDASNLINHKKTHRPNS
ncbi:hypothetical protein GHT06_008358 [Daphnia sinensis]|uniref:C2H2-type domain-containing protein n=1 Tax=Daphnia sinensis TaxID=1820382 RepID=A0AAD5PYW1_9CRUS|nr:hypothetical protein GHT06_008358 [Daphnia sinensis]